MAFFLTKIGIFFSILHKWSYLKKKISLWTNYTLSTISKRRNRVWANKEKCYFKTTEIVYWNSIRVHQLTFLFILGKSYFNVWFVYVYWFC